MPPPRDDRGPNPRASEGPADAGMNKETRFNTVALDLDAVRRIARASKGVPERAAAVEPVPPPSSSAPDHRCPEPSPPKVIVQPERARDNPRRSASVRAPMAPAPPQRLLLVLICACLALLMMLTWRVVVAPEAAPKPPGTAGETINQTRWGK